MLDRRFVREHPDVVKKKFAERGHSIDGESGVKAMAVRAWEKLDPDRIKYEMFFTSTDTFTHDQLEKAREFVENKT